MLLQVPNIAFLINIYFAEITELSEFEANDIEREKLIGVQRDTVVSNILSFVNIWPLAKIVVFFFREVYETEFCFR